MPAKFLNLTHIRVLPQDELVVREAVRGDEFLVGVTPLDRTHLGARVYTLDTGHFIGSQRCIPHPYGLVRGAASRG
jgi:hypothetical protein